MPKENRASPVSWSMPTRPTESPRNRLKRPFTRDGPSNSDTVVNATTVSAKYSAGPEAKAQPWPAAARRTSARWWPSVPATNDPIAAVVSAAAPRPWRAIMYPSMAVAIDPVSPGVLRRMLVVDPPYIAPE